MKKKLSLSELEVKSFKINEEASQLGGSNDRPSDAFVCSGIMNCDSCIGVHCDVVIKKQ